MLAQGAHPQQLRAVAEILPAAVELGRAGQQEKEEGVRRTGLWRMMGRVPHQKRETCLVCPPRQLCFACSQHFPACQRGS